MAADTHLSVIVIPLIGASALANCLNQLPLSALECIVVLRETMGERLFGSSATRRSFSWTHPMSRFRCVANAASQSPPAKLWHSSKTRRGQVQIGALRFDPLSPNSRQPPRAGRCGSRPLCQTDARRLGGVNMAPSRHTICSGSDAMAPTLMHRSSFHECPETTWLFGAQS